MEGRADLHMHTVHSDGDLETKELVRRAKLAGLTTISITDHDNTSAIAEAIEAGRKLGVEVIPGLEISASVGNQEVHILGYFFDPEDRKLLSYLSTYRNERVKRAVRIVEKLNDLNIPLKIESVLEQAGRGSVGRPHIASALLEEGWTGTYHEAFLKYIGFGKPAYEQKTQASPQEAIDLISSAGGLSFIAHPGNMIDESVLVDFIKFGVDGIEVIHPSHSPERVEYYRGITSEYFMLASGGSDYHGGHRNDNNTLGKYYISDEQVEMMRRRL